MDEVLRKAGLFQGVDPEDAEALAEQFEIFEAPRGTILVHEGEQLQFRAQVGNSKLGN